MGICVSDPERSTAVYRDGLGFSETYELTIDGEPAAKLIELVETAAA